MKASPAQLEARYNLATQYLEQDRLDDAIRLLEEAARISPNHEMVRARLGRAYMVKGRGEDAYRALFLVRRLYPENWYAPLGMAALNAANNRPDEARKLLDEALRLGGEKAGAEPPATRRWPHCSPQHRHPPLVRRRHRPDPCPPLRGSRAQAR